MSTPTPPSRHHGLLPTARNHAALRSIDAYRWAKKLGVGVGFKEFEDGVGSMLIRRAKVVILNIELDEMGRHDELAHQLEHLTCRRRFGEDADALEDRIRRSTARRLIPVEPLLDAVTAVLERRDATAVDAANLLGVQPMILRDRIQSLNAHELAAGVEAVVNRLSWPTEYQSPTRLCVQHDQPSKLERFWNLLRRK